ncbi:protein phosphatase 2C domain-containing protein [Patescibacteria group bacterium]|nr:protein phosphatase 2C domain-containing protein [Patescibacteria group bacterium]
MTISAYGGNKPVNEDAMYLGKNGLYIVADGMGGHPTPAIASRLAVKIIAKECPGHKPDPDVLRAALMKANKGLLDCAKLDPSTHDMGTVISVVWIRIGYYGKYVLAHLGDTSVYQFERTAANTRFRITPSHSKDGFITRYLGMRTLTPEMIHMEEGHLGPGGHFLMSSDGFDSALFQTGWSELLGIIQDEEQSLENRVKRLSKRATISFDFFQPKVTFDGNDDDLTVVLIERENPSGPS